MRRRLASIRAARRRLPENVRTLGSVSLANDAASELSYPIVPLFLAVTLGAPILLIGVIEGIAEASALVVRFLSGWLSDRFGAKRRPWIVAGYAVSTLARVVVAAAPAWGWVLGAKITDRVGKGTRGTPRDALIRDSAPVELRGASFGYHRAMDTVGAVLGPLVAVVLLELGCSLRTILWVAVVPGIATLLLLRRIREAPGASAPTSIVTIERVPLPQRFWIVLAIWMIFSFGNSSDVFLLLRAQSLGVGAIVVVLAYALYNAVYAGLSWPLGALSDRVPRHLILTGGLVVFAIVYLGFALSNSAWTVWVLFAVYGVYVAATDGVARAWIADEAGERSIGTAYGIFFLGTAAAALAASVTAGVLWSTVGPRAPFVLGAATAALAAALLVTWSVAERFGARAVQVALATVGAAVLFGAGFEHKSLVNLMSGADVAEGLPLAAAQPCDAPPPARGVAHPFMQRLPHPAGVVYTGGEPRGPALFVDGYIPASIRDARAAYERVLAGRGYTVTAATFESTQGELAFLAGALAGEVRFDQRCRDRTVLSIRFGGGD